MQVLRQQPTTDAVGPERDDSAQPIWVAQRSGWVYLLILPLFLLFGFRYSVGALTYELAGLWLPMAAWLGAHHGKRGFHVVAIGATPLLVGVRVSAFETAADPGVYVAALIVCRLCGRPLYRKETIAADRVTPWMLAFLFLAVPFAAGYARNFGAFGIALWPYLMRYFWILLLVAGLAGLPLRPFVICLVAAAIVGWLIPALGAQPPRFFGFGTTYYLGGPDSVFTGYVALLVGRLLRQRMVLREPTPHAITSPDHALPAVLLVVSLAFSMMRLRVPPPWPGLLESELTFASGEATVLLLFACGLVGGLGAAVLAAVVWVLANTAMPMLITMIQFSAGHFGPVRLGPLTVVSPGTLLGVRFAYAPGLSLALFDFVFAFFGWRVGRRRVPQATWPLAGSVPPQFRLHAIHRAWTVAGGLFLAGTVAFALARLAMSAGD